MDVLHLENSWTFIKKIFPILSNQFDRVCLEQTQYTDEELYNVGFLVKSLNLSNTIQELIFIRVETCLRQETAPEFWSYFKSNDKTGGNYQQFYNAVQSLYRYYQKLENVIKCLERLNNMNSFQSFQYGKHISGALQLIVRSSLLAQRELCYEEVVRDFYEQALKLEDIDGLNKDCVICLLDRNDCLCFELFIETNCKLDEMDLLEPLVGQVLTDLVYVYIHSHIQKICKDSFDVSYIDLLEKWLNIILSWLKKIYRCNDMEKFNNFINNFDKKLVNYLYNTYTKIRIDQLFNIIIEYPESLAALEDLKICLNKTDLKHHLIKKLQKDMETRLLHPGVSTSDVLTAYVAAIRSLRVLDPSGLLLDIVTQPIHHYLRSREDTVRCVVSSLTEEGPNDLAEELARGEAVQLDENLSDNDDNENWQTWTPDPVDVQPITSTPSRRTADIISMLVNVYGSKELFVNEYRTLLADRLLSQYNIDTEKEIRYLELLKLRFGDSQLHYCEVMLKDIVDSKRINQHIKQESEEDLAVSAMIVSAQFWPPFKDEKLELHPLLVERMKTFTNGFETLKGSRTLCWKNHLGIVDIEIEVADRTLNLSVSPVHATIMMHFQDKAKWHLEELSKLIQVPPTILRRKIGFWQSHGLLIETENDVFVVKENNSEVNPVQEDIIVEDYESESAMASAQDQREEELQTFWSYIIGMLMNLDSLSLERIHQMLKMFAFQGPTIECSVQELKLFLDRKVREHQLIHANGLYKLPK